MLVKISIIKNSPLNNIFFNLSKRDFVVKRYAINHPNEDEIDFERLVKPTGSQNNRVKTDSDQIKTLFDVVKKIGSACLNDFHSILAEDELKLNRANDTYPPLLFRSYNLAELFELGEVY